MSRFHYAEDKEGSQCPYCKSPDSNFHHWLYAFEITPEDLEELISRGWQRLGMYIYKKSALATCPCDEYMIRCPALEFQISNSQKKVMKKFVRWLNGGKTENKNAEKKSLEDFIPIADGSGNYVKKFQVKTMKTNSPEFESTFKAEFKVFKKYQKAIHGDKDSEILEWRYRDNYCNSPIISPEGQGQDQDLYGSYHQQYWIYGLLIAVGVIDILPTTLSSPYFIYDPAYKFLSLGIVGALMEIALLRKLHETYPALKYYSLGSYVPNCSKIRYKSEYRPAFIQTPNEPFDWIPLDRNLKNLMETDPKSALPLITSTTKCHTKPSQRLHSFKDLRVRLKGKGTNDRNISKMEIQYAGSVVTYKNYRIQKGLENLSGCMPRPIQPILKWIPPVLIKQNKKDTKEIKKYCEVVGKGLAQRAVLVRDQPYDN